MANFTFDGAAGLKEFYSRLAEVPERVVDDMLEAEAKAVIRAMQKRAPRDTGALAASVAVYPAKSGRTGGRYKTIYPMGGRTRGKNRKTRTRNSEIAFIQHYGLPRNVNPFRKDGRPKKIVEPTYWADKALEDAEEEAVDAAAEVYGRFLDGI
jgi:hypothetical protein